MKKKDFSLHYFYSIFSLSCLSDRFWLFTVIFILQEIGGLKLIAISQFFNGLATILLSGILGKWLDKQKRIKSMTFVLFLNNICITLCSITYMIILKCKIDNEEVIYDLLVYFGLILNALSEVASQGERMLLSKDWILVLINNDESKLSKKNATMTTLDQIMCITAPLIIGILLKNFDYSIVCATFTIWNLLSWIIEYILLKKLYSTNSNLQHKINCVNRNEEEKNEEEKIEFLGILKLYFSQSTFLAAISLSLLYMTVLAFDGLSLAYAKAQNVSEDILGLFRSVSAITGIIGSFLYVKLESKFGAPSTSLFGIFIQQFFGYCCLVSLILPGTPFYPSHYFNEWNFKDWAYRLLSLNDNNFKSSTSLDLSSSSVNPSIWVYLVTITFSRIGLWINDLAITHQMQNTIKENDRATVFGIQNSLCSFFSTMKDIFVILFPDIRTFGILMIISVAFGTISLLLNVFYFVKIKRQKL
uniref:Solute carrier family 40 member n=1 Tax=Parastrongyloides trichosuri TaxID=131310 RepID=A0A0N4ZTH7_PARTI